MVRRWLRLRSPGWRRSALVNGVGATATGVVLIVVAVTKLIHGAWIVLLLLLLLLLMLVFRAIHRHYEQVAEQLPLTQHHHRCAFLLEPIK